MAEPKPRVRIPKSVQAGSPFRVRTRITHPMHTGLRNDSDGTPVPRRIINRFLVRFDGVEALSVDLQPAVSADPYFEFEIAVPASGVLEFDWIDDDGSVFSLRKQVVVE